MGEDEKAIQEESSGVITCGPYKLCKEEGVWGPQLKISRGKEFVFYAENNPHMGGMREILWAPNPTLSKDALVKIVIEEGLKLVPYLRRVFSKAELSRFEMFWREIDSGTGDEKSKFLGPEQTYEHVTQHPKYDGLIGFRVVLNATDVGFRSYGVPWSQVPGDICVHTEHPQLEWLANFFYRTSPFSRELEGLGMNLLDYSADM